MRETPDCQSPTRVAPFSLATFLTLASNDDESSVVSMLKVLVKVPFPPSYRPKDGPRGLSPYSLANCTSRLHEVDNPRAALHAEQREYTPKG